MARQRVFEIEIGGKKRTLDFGLYCWEVFCEKMNVPPGEILGVFQGPATFKAMRILLFSAIIANDFLYGQPNSVTEREVAGWLNDDPGKIQEIFTIAISNLMPEVQEDVPQKVSKDNKKKASRSKTSKK